MNFQLNDSGYQVVKIRSVLELNLINLSLFYQQTILFLKSHGLVGEVNPKFSCFPKWMSAV